MRTGKSRWHPEAWELRPASPQEAFIRAGGKEEGIYSPATSKGEIFENVQGQRGRGIWGPQKPARSTEDRSRIGLGSSAET